MIFAEPIPFKEAIEGRSVKVILPTSMSSKELERVAAELRERAVFSAKVENAGFLEKMDRLIQRIVSPETVDGRAAEPGEYMDQATARLELKQYLQSIGYQPDADKRGTLQDLSSDERLNLIVRTNSQMAQGYGSWQQGQDASVLDEWPAQELFRAEAREKERDWAGRWADAGGQFYDGGRMIALKNDPIWIKISRFGLPYAPFDFNSGMDLRDIDRDEATELGVIDPGAAAPDPQSRKFNDDLELTPDVRQENLLSALLQSLGDSAKLVDGVLKLVA